MLGKSPGTLSLLRLDLVGGAAPGNKRFKLNGYLQQAAARGITRLVSFGGAWSNHLHALAAVGQQQGLETVGIVRGDTPGKLSATLEEARRWGMRIVPVSRAEYRLRNEDSYQRQLVERFAPCLLVPEGGASATGAVGCGAIADRIRELAPGIRHIAVPVGTGATLAGLVASLDDSYDVLGVSALKGAVDLEQRVQGLLDVLAARNHARWRIDHDHHCGGFARVDSSLKQFILAFEAVHAVQLDPVYTAKMLYALYQSGDRGTRGTGTPTLAIHTGGLQGRRGYAWLDEDGAGSAAATSPRTDS